MSDSGSSSGISIEMEKNMLRFIFSTLNYTMDYTKFIHVVPDFPKKGISFKDISPLLRDYDAFSSCIEDLAKLAAEYHPTVIIGAESRGFLFGPALAQKLHIGFVMARKAGKLPGETVKISYQLEYGTATLEVPANSFTKGDRVVLIDDLLATGGTMKAMKELVELCEATPVVALTLITLKELEGEKNVGIPCKTLMYLSDSH